MNTRRFGFHPLARAALAVLLLLALLIAPVRVSRAEEPFAVPDEWTVQGLQGYLKGKSIGIVTGTIFDAIADEQFPDSKKVYYASVTDLIAALKAKKIDAFLSDQPVARNAMAQSSELYMPDCVVVEDCYGFAMPKTDTALCEQLNQTLARLKSDGTLDQIDARWFSGDESQYALGDYALTGENGTLRVAVDASQVPFAMLKDNTVMGYEIEILYHVAADFGYDLEFTVTDFASIIPGVLSGKYDLGCCCISITEERAKSVLFSDPDYIGGVVMVLPAALKPAEKATDLNTLEGAKAFLEGESIGVLEGSTHEGTAQRLFPDSPILHFNSNADAVLAVLQDKVRAQITDWANYAEYLRQGLDVYAPPLLTLDTNQYAFALSKSSEALRDRLNQFLADLKADGTLDALKTAYGTGKAESFPSMTALSGSGEAGQIIIAITGDHYPFCYNQGGEQMGYEIELLIRFANQYGYSLRFDSYNFSGMIAAVSSGKADIAASTISVTEERKESMLFSDPTFDNRVVLIMKGEYAPAETTKSIADYNQPGVRIALPQGSASQSYAERYFDKAELVYFTNNSDLTAALKAGKVDAIAHDNLTCVFAQDEVEGSEVLQDSFGDISICVGLPKNRADLQAQINELIKGWKSDGTLDEMYAYWIDGRNTAMPTIALPTAPTGTLRIGTSAQIDGRTFYADGVLTGYDIELSERIGLALNMSVEFSVMDYGSLIAGLSGGRLDLVVANLNITPERQEAILFSDSYMDCYSTLLVLSEDAAAQGGATFFEGVAASFERTFLREDRWKMMAQGLWTTLVISVLSALAGTLIGFGICMARRSRHAWLCVPAKVLIRVIQGTPIVVILMILYFIVFGDVDPVLVAVIGFSINFGVYASEMMRTGIDAVDRGQIEAASALGYTRAQAFLYITLPQAARHFLPVYKGEFISMVKMTSVVGYISIMDLTKMSDLIRSRTYEAFFPLITTAVIYFVITWLLTLALSAIEIRIDPKRKRRLPYGIPQAALYAKEEKAQ